MASIYIHIPFCFQRCDYCNFFSSTRLQQKSAYLLALKKELILRKNYLEAEPIESIYFGGGTPSVLTANEIDDIISCISDNYIVSSYAEITLEANPNNLCEEYFKNLTTTRINRLSIGIQSFNDDNLKILGRIHSGKQAEDCLLLAEKYNFNNLSIDLMYGYPLLTIQQWIANLEKVKDVKHLSCYCLTLEKQSVLYKRIKNQNLQQATEDDILQQIEILEEFAQQNNFIHYETSNFCKKDFHSRHNTAYWQNKSYLGVGCSAHSFNKNSRQWNLSNIDLYINKLNKIKDVSEFDIYEYESLSKIMQINEYIMTSLRTIWGCDLDYISKYFSEEKANLLKEKLTLIDTKNYILKNNILQLSPQGQLLADAIACQLFFEEE